MQELTLTGGYVRSVGVGQIDAIVYGIAAWGELLALGLDSKTKPVMVLNSKDGSLLRTFGGRSGGKGKGKGQHCIKSCSSLLFTPDGAYLLIVDTDSEKLSLFTTAGEFVRGIGVGALAKPTDISLASSGDILVVDGDNNCVFVFSPDGSLLLRAFGGKGSVPAKFYWPNGIAVQGAALFVLDEHTGRVQVFL